MLMGRAEYVDAVKQEASGVETYCAARMAALPKEPVGLRRLLMRLHFEIDYWRGKRLDAVLAADVAADAEAEAEEPLP
jgi:hypothetical protein